MFADDTSLLSVVNDPKKTSLSPNKNLLKINQWAYQWKMLFNPDTSRQPLKPVFSRKKYSNLWNYFLYQFFNSKGEYKKTSRCASGYKIKFLTHINQKIKKSNKGISVSKKSTYHYHVLH